MLAGTKEIQRKDYTKSAYLIKDVNLTIELENSSAKVTSAINFTKNINASSETTDLLLNGEEVELISLEKDGRLLEKSDYCLDSHGLTLLNPGDEFSLKVITQLNPADNTKLEGLYKSGQFFLTQCEAEGFRRITYYLDRPDVMTEFTVKIIADQNKYPILLSNGNKIDAGILANGKHFVTWHDPFPKPSYLFALVAGDLACIEHDYKTQQGEMVKLAIYAEEHNIDKCQFAMESLIKAMIWDEERFELSYDLQVYNIVATDDFNMGAMENKSLNIFNSQYVLAKPETATDQDYLNIESVIGHEYFHNWTGNRVTCRDWFQLSLKEGLTVFRDQEFSADMQSRGVHRIEDVKTLKVIQFPEDSGPMAHPVRPESYLEIDNFYTATVYNKGAEVVRMYQTLLGSKGFNKGLSLYFERHDGQAVTCDDFRLAMADANNYDLAQFELWYSQAGTPVLSVDTCYRVEQGEFEITIEQSIPDTPGQTDKQPMHIPIAIGLLANDGQEIGFQVRDNGDSDIKLTQVLELKEQRQTFVIGGVGGKPTLSLLRDFSAPVKADFAQSNDDLALLMMHDTDPYSRWDACMRLATRTILSIEKQMQNQQSLVINERFVYAFGQNLQDRKIEQSMLTELLWLPNLVELIEQQDQVNLDTLIAARKFVKSQIATLFTHHWQDLYNGNVTNQPYEFTASAVGQRKLKNCALAYLGMLDNDEYQSTVYRQFQNANNMTDSIAALNILVHENHSMAERALNDFYDRWQQEPLVINKWLQIQATRPEEKTLDIIKELLHHPGFSIKNPNKVTALIGSFGRFNFETFHMLSGLGYQFLAEQIIIVDKLNRQMGARLASNFNAWRKFDPKRQELMQNQLKAILASDGLSRNTYEIVKRALN